MDIVQYKKDRIDYSRGVRNQLLQQSDKYMFQDYPINDYQRS